MVTEFSNVLIAVFTGLSLLFGYAAFKFNRHPTCVASVSHWKGRICRLTIRCSGKGSSTLFKRIKVDGWVIAPAETKLGGGYVYPPDDSFGPYLDGEFLVSASPNQVDTFTFFIKRLSSHEGSTVIHLTLVGSDPFSSCKVLAQTRKHVDKEIEY